MTWEHGLFVACTEVNNCLVNIPELEQAIGRDPHLTQPEFHRISLVGFCCHACVETWDTVNVNPWG